MRKRFVEYNVAELESLQSRITKLSDDIYYLVDQCHEKGQNSTAHRLKLDIYFLSGMRQMIDVLINSPTEIYPRLHEETIAVEKTIHSFIFKGKFDD